MKLTFKNKICKECKVEFTPTSGVQIFCDKKCKRKYYNVLDLKKEIRICKNCGKKFTPNSHSQKYCSAKCNVKRNGKVATKTEIVNCKSCGKSFEKKYYQNIFCSVSCRTFYNKPKRRVKIPRKKVTKIEERECVICKNKFSCLKYIKKSTCSKKCTYALISIKNKCKGHKTSQETKLKQSLTRKRLIANGTIKISPKSSRSKHTYYKDIMFRSPWEAKVAKYLDDNNIKWEYENHKRKIPLKNGSSYIVDFYLPETDRYIEVKGWWDKKSIEKCDQLLIYFEHDYSKLLIVDKNNIDNINLNRHYAEQSDYVCKYEERKNEI